MAEVYAKFPKTGLGNMMLVWARAVVFSHHNQLPYHASLWWGLRPGAFLRNEQKKRFYYGYFIETPLLKLVALNLKKAFSHITFNPSLSTINIKEKEESRFYFFDKVIIDEDLFGYIRNHGALIKTELWKILHPKQKAALAQCKDPFISIHVRRGDFKFGSPITPNTFFIEAIHQIRETVGENCPVTVFTDARKEEIEDILALPNVSMANNNADIIDILQMSRSKVLILSKSSTFSYWGAFLSDAVIIRPDGDWQPKIKNAEQGSNYIEVNWNPDNELANHELINALEERYAARQTEIKDC